MAISKSQKAILKAIESNDKGARGLVEALELVTAAYYEANQPEDLVFFHASLSHRPQLAKAAKKIIERVTPVDIKAGRNKKIRKGVIEVYKAANEAFIESAFETLQEAAVGEKKEKKGAAYNLEKKVESFAKQMDKAIDAGELTDHEAEVMYKAMVSALASLNAESNVKAA